MFRHKDLYSGQVVITPTELQQKFCTIRATTESLCEPLLIEDYVIQSCEDVSPPKWHLAHTTWFYEAFILSPYFKGYRFFDPHFLDLFNSYYQGIGVPYPRAYRGLLARPSVDTVYHYREKVNQSIMDLLSHLQEEQWSTVLPLMELGLNHEQQHQELLLMDIKHNLSLNPDDPVYHPLEMLHALNSLGTWIDMEGGMFYMGHSGEGFCFDNELPRHQKFLHPYALQSKLVTNQEYLEFMEEGGYNNPKWWLSDGWDAKLKYDWNAPLYWKKGQNEWTVFTLGGRKKWVGSEPVCHISYFEADAYARWKGYRLPTEEEWEYVAQTHQLDVGGHFMEARRYHPCSSGGMTDQTPQQMFGDVWEWTSSEYSPYPGFKPLQGDVGEYNGKFMHQQKVLKGGCCVTPQDHIRSTYRNFYGADKRWLYSGFRLAMSRDGF